MVFGFFEPDVPEIDARDVFSALRQHEDVSLIDVRTTEEYKKEHIEGSVLVPITDIGSIIEIVPDKSKKIILYCRSGSRSKVAVEKMLTMGYSQVFSMTSGLLAWHVYQFPVTQNN